MLDHNPADYWMALYQEFKRVLVSRKEIRELAVPMLAQADELASFIASVLLSFEPRPKEPPMLFHMLRVGELLYPRVLIEWTFTDGWQLIIQVRFDEGIAILGFFRHGQWIAWLNVSPLHMMAFELKDRRYEAMFKPFLSSTIHGHMKAFLEDYTSWIGITLP